MAGTSISELLFYGGLALMGCAAAGAVAALVLFHITGRRLENQLDREYGKKRRG